MLKELSLHFGDRMSITGTSYLGARPGDILLLNYERVQRLGLVVASKRTANGLFISTRKNTLLNMFLLDNVSTPMLDVIVNTLYRDRLRCTYLRAPRILGMFFAKDSFRTFNVSKASNFLRVNIK